ncbi:MAG: acyltransferase family protein, partial [Ignavibacteriae bacterium]|nr:acyltransferase family protein [Ignavibacteriota bacterium]
LQNSVDYSSYFDFYKTVFNFVAYPEGSFSWHHLWFLPYLFSYSVIGLPLFLFLKSEKGEILLEKVARFLAIKGTLFLAVIPLALTYGFLRLDWPDNRNLIQDWYNFTFYFLIFLYGYIICSYQKFWSIIENNRFISLVVAIISVTILYLFAWTPIYDYFSYKDNTIYLYGFLKSLNIWAWLMVILGFSSKLLNKPSNMLSYLNESVYPFYILHQTIIVVLGYYIVQWEISSTEKFLLLVFITFTLCFTFYELLIRHTRITRFVFGLKTKETIKAKNR